MATNAVPSRPAAAPAVRFITRDELCQRWGVSRATTYRLEKLGHLPRPVRLGPASARWPLLEIERIEERAAADRGEVKP